MASTFIYLPFQHYCNLYIFFSHLFDPPVTAGSGLVMMIFGGQLVAYKLFRSNFVYPAELQNF